MKNWILERKVNRTDQNTKDPFTPGPHNYCYFLPSLSDESDHSAVIPSYQHLCLMHRNSGELVPPACVLFSKTALRIRDLFHRLAQNVLIYLTHCRLRQQSRTAEIGGDKQQPGCFLHVVAPIFLERGKIGSA